MIRTATACTVLALLAAGCGRDAQLRCENPEAYYNAAQRPPIRVPDDLSVPDQSEALSIPPRDRIGTEAPATPDRPCLEFPPRFYEGIEDAEGATTSDAAAPPG